MQNFLSNKAKKISYITLLSTKYDTKLLHKLFGSAKLQNNFQKSVFMFPEYLSPIILVKTYLILMVCDGISNIRFIRYGITSTKYQII